MGLLFIASPILPQATSTAQNPRVVFSSPGVKQVTLRVCNAAGCKSITQSVTVLDPMPRIVSLGSVPPLVGAGQMVSLSAQTSGRPALTHRWTVSGTTGNLVLTGNPAQWNTGLPGIGTYQVRLEVLNTDGSVLSDPVAVNVARMTFADVPPTYWAWQFVETLYALGITSGCSAVPLLYCPTSNVSRAEMAVFLVRAGRGSTFVPPPPIGIFTDVPVGYWAAPYIEQIYADSITAGCSLSPLSYCPDAPLNRAQMAVFLLRAKHGSLYVPPPATGTVFADVPAGSFAAAWIEQLAAEGITSGCATSPARYCPDTSVSRDQMATFLVRTFNLTNPNP
jgi:S-layer family protein